MTKSLPAIYGYSKDSIKEKILGLEKLGFSREDIIKMLKFLPPIFGYSMDNINKKLTDLEELGYSREDIIDMIKAFPTIMGYSIDNIKKKFDDLEKIGFSEDEIISMTKSLPALLGLSIENIKEKIEFYDSIGMHDLASHKPRYLMQSVSLSYARYQFYLSRGITIRMDNYKRLFISNKDFLKQYLVTKTDLLNMYRYEDREKKNERVI